MSSDLIFPENFLWGSALSAHQAEGNNTKNDWWVFEQQPNRIKNGERSGVACDHYNRFESDYKLFSELGQTAHRNGFEWSRIVPEEGVVDVEEIEHYHKVIEAMKKHNLTPFMTVHHFTVPQWFAKKGGFLKTKNLRFFEHYCEVLAKNFHELEYWNTINEPIVYALEAYLAGIFPPARRSLFAYFKVARNIMLAHAIAYKKIKEHNPKAKAGLVKNFTYFPQRYGPKKKRKLIAYIADNNFNQAALNAIRSGTVPFSLLPIKNEILKDSSDFIGVNYYIKGVFKTFLGIPYSMLLSDPGERTTQMGWGTYPYGLYHSIIRTWKTLKKPIYVTENGIATLDDEWRKKFILEHLVMVHKAIQEGVDVRGYFYWSSIDNFEWAEGFTPRFGLIGINYDTQERIIRDSARMFGRIATENKIPASLLDQYNISSQQ